MGRITMDARRDGLDGFPSEFEVVGRDDLGDVLAIDGKGKVWTFAHDAGDWHDRSKAFDSVQLLHEHIACQRHFEVPPADLDLPALLARKQAIEAFLKGRRGAPYSRDAGKTALADLREEIADRRFWSSKRGRGLAACQEAGMRCDQLLRDAGAPGEWMCRAVSGDGSVLGVMGDFTPPWTEARVRELLAPLVGARELRLLPRPQPKP
ncbi:MAG: hypothetical protein FJ301_01565 [Planctomycetes bacterium]|nr:hypothetical protein [Planctomycetota bacterium]